MVVRFAYSLGHQSLLPASSGVRSCCAASRLAQHARQRVVDGRLLRIRPLPRSLPAAVSESPRPDHFSFAAARRRFPFPSPARPYHLLRQISEWVDGGPGTAELQLGILGPSKELDGGSTSASRPRVGSSAGRRCGGLRMWTSGRGFTGRSRKWRGVQRMADEA